MNPIELTHVWSEAPQLSDALSQISQDGYAPDR